MVIQVDKGGFLTDSTIDTSRKADEDFANTRAFYEYLSSDGDTDLRDDLRRLHFYGYVKKYRDDSGSTGSYTRTFEEYKQTDFYDYVETAYNSGNFIDYDEFQRLLVDIEVEFQVDIFSTVAGYVPPTPKPNRNTELAGIIAKVSLENAKNNSLNANEIQIINQLVKYDQNNGKDPEYNNSHEKDFYKEFKKNNVEEYHAMRLYNVTDTDVRNFGSKNGLNQAEINKVLELTRKWRSEASDDFFKRLY